MSTIHEQIAQTSGIPLGGLGTGSVEIRPDGYLHEWQMFNLGPWAPRQPEGKPADQPEMPPGALAFYLRTASDGASPLMRRLGMRTDQHNLYSYPWLKSVQAIDFTGRYPVADLAYRDADLPVEVSARFFSPFVPHDARTSGTPGFHAVFNVRNRTDRPVTASLLTTLQNPIATGAPDGQRRNRVTRHGDTTFLTFRAAPGTPQLPTLGSLCLALSGGDPSWITGDYRSYFRGYAHSHWSKLGPTTYGMALEDVFTDFRESGRLLSLPGDRSMSARFPATDAEVDALSSAEARALLEEILCYPFARTLWDKVARVAPALLRGREGRTTFLKQIRIRFDHLAGRDRKWPMWGDGALCSTLELAPREEREVRLALGWHFPFHYSAKGPVLGHQYEHWFEDAEDVGRFLADHADEHARTVDAFSRTLHDTTLPPECADAWGGQLTTLAKCTWWTKAGDFAVWEGLGCCGFHTTDITYQGSFNILALFPELQQRQMQMGARFQRPDGRVHHFFTPDLSEVDNGFDRVDMNQQFVLLVCRDYLWTGDRAFLRGLWPNIVRAMNDTAALDRDGDGLPDHETQRNTYDAWDFSGTPSYIASLWLSALLAAVRIAGDLGHRREAAEWGRLLKKAGAAFDRKLWNGRYYSLYVDGRERDECCMTDQIDGEWFTTLAGLGHVLPRERIRAALAAIVSHNFSAETGLLNATYPPGTRPHLAAYRNIQAVAPWTGIEYAIASMLMDFGYPAEGLAVVQAVHDRHLRAGRFWNHVECGDHYYRAMSSWAVLLGATGFKVDAPRGALAIVPAVPMPRFRAPWVSSTGWGAFEQTAGRFELECRSGTLAFRTLRLGLAGKTASVTLNGVPLRAAVCRDGATLVLSFSRPVTMKDGGRLTVA